MPDFDGLLLFARARCEEVVIVRPRNAPDDPRVGILDPLQKGEVERRVLTLEEAPLAVS